MINCGDDDFALAPHLPLPRPQAERAAGWPEASLPAIGSPVSFAVRATFRCPELPGGFLCDVYSAFWTRLGEKVARARLVTSICGHFLGFLSIACLHTCGREQITCVQTYIDGVVLRRDVFGSSPAHRSRSITKPSVATNQSISFLASSDQAPQRQRFSLGR